MLVAVRNAKRMEPLDLGERVTVHSRRRMELPGRAAEGATGLDPVVHWDVMGS
jgi:hypothetical protein